MATAFVTGATGFIGAAVARALLLRGWSVRALARPGSDPRNLQELRMLAESSRVGDSGATFERHEGDLRDPDSLRRGLEGSAVLYHVAARYALWNPRPREIYVDNVDGTRNVLTAARAACVERVVYTSTVGTVHIPVGGCGNENRFAEIHEVKGHYKRSKWLAEQEARRIAADGLPVVIVHPTAPVGPFDVKPTPTGRMIVDFLDGKAMAYIDTGLNIVDVEDVAEGHILAAERGVPGESYILGSENMSLRHIYETLGEIAHLRAPRVRMPKSCLVPISIVTEALARVTGKTPLVPWETVYMSAKRMYFETGKARDELGFEPRPARLALERAVRWFFEGGFTRRPPRPGVLEGLVHVFEESF